MTDTDQPLGMRKREWATVAVLCLFVAVFLTAIGVVPDYGHRPADAAIEALAEEVADGRRCGVPEREIGRLVLDRIREIGRMHPDVPQSEIIMQLANTTSRIEGKGASRAASCAIASTSR